MATDKYSSSKSETGYNYTITQNNPWFGQKYKSYDTNEGGGYHYIQYPDGNFAIFDGHTGEYRLVTDQKQKDYLTKRTAALEQNSNNENQNWFGYTFKPKTSFGQWLGNLKNGGNMTYANYLQEGGLVSALPSSRKEQLKASVIQALLSAKSEDEAMQIMQELQLMAQQDPDAAEVLQELAQEMQGVSSNRRGGEVVKADLGIALLNGAKKVASKLGLSSTTSDYNYDDAGVDNLNSPYSEAPVIERNITTYGVPGLTPDTTYRSIPTKRYGTVSFTGKTNPSQPKQIEPTDELKEREYTNQVIRKNGGLLAFDFSEVNFSESLKCGGKIKKAKKCENGTKLDKDLKNILMAAKCGGKAKKTKKCEEGGELTLDFSMIDFAKCGKKLQKKEVGGEVAEEKCGGKAKKVKKAEFGSPVTFGKKQEESYVKYGANGGKAGCQCKLHRIGGRIVEVDCNGNIVKRK